MNARRTTDPNLSGKSRKRREKKARMAAMYRDFFADPRNMAKVRALKFEWGIDLCPRLVRDTTLGSPWPKVNT